MPDNNVTPYWKLNELIITVNEHSAALRELKNVFVEMHTMPGVWGYLARATFAHYVRTSPSSTFPFIDPIDIPPVTPGTLEMNHDGVPSVDHPVRIPPRRRPPSRSE